MKFLKRDRITLLIESFLIGIVGMAIIVFLIEAILGNCDIRYELTNLWGKDFLFYPLFILLPVSYLVETTSKINKESRKYLTWGIFPLLYLIVFLGSFSSGLLWQLNKFNGITAMSIIDNPTFITFEIDKLFLFEIIGILIGVGTQILWIRKLKN